VVARDGEVTDGQCAVIVNDIRPAAAPAADTFWGRSTIRIGTTTDSSQSASVHRASGS
jgi:hypothetical protein